MYSLPQGLLIETYEIEGCGLPRYIAICDISRYFLYIAIRDISPYFFGISRYKRARE